METWTESKSREDGCALSWAAKKDFDIRLQGKKLNQRDKTVYLGGAVAWTAAQRRKFAGEYKLRQVRGVKWKG